MGGGIMTAAFDYCEAPKVQIGSANMADGRTALTIGAPFSSILVVEGTPAQLLDLADLIGNAARAIADR